MAEAAFRKDFGVHVVIGESINTWTRNQIFSFALPKSGVHCRRTWLPLEREAADLLRRFGLSPQTSHFPKSRQQNMASHASTFIPGSPGWFRPLHYTKKGTSRQDTPDEGPGVIWRVEHLMRPHGPLAAMWKRKHTAHKHRGEERCSKRHGQEHELGLEDRYMDPH